MYLKRGFLILIVLLTLFTFYNNSSTEDITANVVGSGCDDPTSQEIAAAIKITSTKTNKDPLTILEEQISKNPNWNDEEIRNELGEGKGCIDDYSLEEADDCWNEGGLCVQGKGCVKFEDMGWDEEVVEIIKTVTFVDEGDWRNARIRYEIAQRLRPLATEEIIPVLLKLIKTDPIPNVRYEAANLLIGLLDHEESASLFLEMIQSELKLEKFVAVKTLGKLKEERAIPYFKEILESEDSIDKELHSSVIYAMWDMNFPEIVPAILKFVKNINNNGVNRQSAIALLGYRNHPEIAPTIIKIFESEEGFIVSYAANALGRISSRESLTALVNALNYEDKKLTVIESLMEINSLRNIPESTIPSLIREVESNSEQYGRMTSAISLIQIILANDIKSNDKVYEQFFSYLKEKAPLIEDYPEDERNMMATLMVAIFYNLYPSDIKSFDYTPKYFTDFTPYDPGSFLEPIKETPLFKKIYSNTKIGFYSTVQRNSIAISVFKYLSETEPTDREIDNAIEFILGKREKFENKQIIGKDNYFILFTHQDPKMNSAKTKAFAMGRGIENYPPINLKGIDSKNDIKKFIIDSRQYGDTTILANVHGLPSYLCLSGGVLGGGEDINTKTCLGFNYDEFADILLERENLEEVTLIIAACYGNNFAENLINNLREKNSKTFPTIITAANKNQVTYVGVFLNSLISLGLEPLEPLLGKHIYESEEFSTYYQDLVVFFSEDGEFPLKIAMDSLNPSSCGSCVGDTCPAYG